MKIYNPHNVEIFDIQVDDSSVRYRSIMTDDSLTLNFSLTESIEIPQFSYVSFEGERYTLWRPSEFKKHNTRNHEYTLTLHGWREYLKFVKYKDMGAKPYRLKFPLTAKPITFLQNLVNCLNDHDVAGGWSVGDCLDVTEKTLSFNHEFCLDVLNRLATEFDTEFEFEGKKIHLRKVEKFKNVPLALSYGKGNGFLPGVGRYNEGDKQPVGRLFVQGGERNIDFSTYGSRSLLLPKSQTLSVDGKTFRADAAGMFITRDGNDNKAEDSLDASNVYPKRVGTVSHVIAVDESKNFFDIRDTSIPADLDFRNYRIAGEKAIIKFESGALAGREFDIEQTDTILTGYIHAERRFKIVPAELDGFVMPGGIFTPKVGDKYAIFNISMPQAYISDNATRSGASWDMFREAARYFAENENERFRFTGELDGVWSKSKWLEIGGKITPGGHVLFSDTQFQKQGAVIRITAIKDYVNKPHKPEITLSNAPISSGFSADMGKLEADEVVIEESKNAAIRFAKRQWRDTRETMEMLEKSMLNFSSSINPLTIQTMQLVAGDESLQFRFVNNKTNPQPIVHNVVFNSANSRLTASSGILQHMTIGITDIKNSRAANEFRYWDMEAYLSPPLMQPDKAFFLYARCSRSGTAGTFILSETAVWMESESGFFHFLVGIVNSENSGSRSFAPLYGYTEVLPGRITTDRIVSNDGRTFVDLAKGIIGGRIQFLSGNSTTDLSEWATNAQEDIDKAVGGSVRSTAVAYAVSTNGGSAPANGWQATVPTTVAGQFLWTRTILTLQNGSETVSYSVARHGDTGTTGRGISSIEYKHRVTATNVQPTQGWTDAGWTVAIPATTATNRWLWQIERITYTTGTPLTQDTVMLLAVHGETGEDGSNFSWNLLLDSKRELSGTSYPVAFFTATRDFVPGEILTVTIKGNSRVTGSLNFGVWFNREYLQASTNIPEVAPGVYSQAIVVPEKTVTRVVGLYLVDNQTAGREWEFEWIKLEAGRNKSLDWSPAPEELPGRGISSIEYKHRVTATNVQPTQGWADAGWTVAIPATTATNRWLWQIERITYTSGTPLTQDTISLSSVHGATGEDGSNFSWNLLTDTTAEWHTAGFASGSAYGVYRNGLDALFESIVNQIVVFSFDVKIDRTDNSPGRVQFYGANGSPKFVIPTRIFTGITSEWQRITYVTRIEARPNNTGVNQSRIEIWGADAATTRVHIRNVKLELGDRATDWSPHPDDLPGRGISLIEYKYRATATNVQPTQAWADAGWTVAAPTTNTTNRWLWMIERITYTSGTPLTQDTISLSSVHGETGAIISGGRMLYRDPEFRVGLNGTRRYNNAGATTMWERVAKTADAPTASTHMMRYVHPGGVASVPGFGGFTFLLAARRNAVFIAKIVAKVPIGQTINFATNAVGDGSVQRWLTSWNGTGRFTDYFFELRCGDTGSFGDTMYFWFGGEGSSITADIAFATVYDMTQNDDTADNALSTANNANDKVDNLQVGSRNYYSLTRLNDFGFSGSVFTRLRLALLPNTDYIVCTDIAQGEGGEISGCWAVAGSVDTAPQWEATPANSVILGQPRIVRSDANGMITVSIRNTRLANVRNGTRKVWVTLGNRAVDWTEAIEDVQTRAAKAQADADRATSITDKFGTTIDGGLISTVRTELREANSREVTAGLNGIQGANANNPAFWAGGTYEQALLNKAKAAIRHNGWMKFGDGIIGDVLSVQEGRVSVMDVNNPNLERWAFSRDEVARLTDLLNANTGNGSVALNATLSPQSITLEGSLNVTRDGSDLTLSPRVGSLIEFRLSGGFWDPPTNMPIPSAELVLLRNGVRYRSLESVAPMYQDGNGSYDTSVIIPTAFFRGCPIGTYTLRIEVYNGNGWSDLSVSVSATTLAWSFVQANFRRFEFGVNGMIAYYPNCHLNFTEGGGFDLRGATNMPGVLLSGSVNSGGDPANSWGHLRPATGSVSARNSTGRYTINHRIGHTSYHISALPSTANRACCIVSKANNQFVIEWRTITTTPALADTAFDFQVTGNNY